MIRLGHGEGHLTPLAVGALVTGFLLAAALERLPLPIVYTWATTPENQEPVRLLRENGFGRWAESMIAQYNAPDKQRGGVFATAANMLGALAYQGRVSDQIARGICYDQAGQAWSDRSYSCRVTTLFYDVVRPGTTDVLGTVDIGVETDAEIYWNQHHADWQQRLTVEDVTGEMVSSNFESTFGCFEGEAACNPEFSQPSSTLEKGRVWSSAGEVRFEAPVEGQLCVANMRLGFRFTPAAPQNWTPVVKPGALNYPTIRCDNQMKPGQIGCVHTGQTPVLPYFDPCRHGELAGRIAAAQASGVAGSLESGVPLTKATREIETENRDNACKANPRVPAERPVLDCDEYPFASFAEGAAAWPVSAERTFDGCSLPLVSQTPTGPGYSICQINRGQNRAGGSELRWFYAWNRVLQYDEFYVSVSGGSLPTEG